MTPKRDRVLVTGSEGFIGSHLVEALVRKGYDVRALIQYNFRGHWGWIEDVPPESMRNVEVFPADLRDPFVVRKAVAGCRKVFHLGALIAIPYSYVAPQEYVQTNVIGTLNVLQSSLEEKVEQVIHTSTSETYGTAQYVPIDEKHPLQGQSPYSATKIAADKLAESYYLSYGLPVSTVRPFNTYGPRQSARAVIPTIIAQAFSEKEIRLGSLDPVRDLTYVADTVDGFVRVSENPGSIGEVINLGNGMGISVGDLAKKILNLMRVDKPVLLDEQRRRPEKSEVLNLVCDNRKAEAIIGWKPRISLDDGLQSTIEWLSGRLSLYKSGLYNR